MIRRALKFLAEHLAASALSAAGTQIGESVGKRVGAKIYVEPETTKDEDEEDEK
jgi:hypothetical protein